MFTILFVGFTLGVCAKYLILGNSSGNFILPILVGMLGSLIGFYIIINTAEYKNDVFAATMGSLIALFIYRLIVLKVRNKIIHH